MVFITAEIGTNHVGSIDIAKKIIDVVVETGCHPAGAAATRRENPGGVGGFGPAL